MAREDIPLDLLNQTIRWGRKEKREERERKEREEEGGERSSTFSLEFSAIKLLFLIEARGKVRLRDEGFA